MRAVLVPSSGAADVLQVTEVDRPSPGAGQVLVRVAVAGVNYMDVYQRSGAVSLPTPFVAGVEGVGTVAEIGDGVDDLAIGRRVGWLRGGQGSYAEYVLVDSAMAVPIPDAVPDDVAAAVLMQGVTAHYLATDTYRVQPGDTVLVHSAAGGVGQLLTQVVTLRGGRVIGTVSTEQKAEVARAAGAEEVLRYEEVPVRVRQLTDGNGVAVVYDGVGGATFDASLASLRPRGVLVVYGTSSGPTPPLEIPRLNSGGSLYVTRPTVVHYTATREELRARTDELFGWVASGQLRVSIGGRYPLADAARAHQDLESRRTTGKLLLFPADGAGARLTIRPSTSFVGFPRECRARQLPDSACAAASSSADPPRQGRRRPGRHRPAARRAGHAAGGRDRQLARGVRAGARPGGGVPRPPGGADLGAGGRTAGTAAPGRPSTRGSTTTPSRRCSRSSVRRPATCGRWPSSATTRRSRSSRPSSTTVDGNPAAQRDLETGSRPRAVAVFSLAGPFADIAPGTATLDDFTAPHG